MSNALVKWSCSQCGDELEEQQPQHKACHARTKWFCVWSEASGWYKSYARHAKRCEHCSPDRLREINAAEQSDKENRISTTAELESSQAAGTPDSNEAVDG